MTMIPHFTVSNESTRSEDAVPLFLRQLSPDMRERVRQAFWCDFSDIIPNMAWDDPDSTQ